jgi:hypothetical protein
MGVNDVANGLIGELLDLGEHSHRSRWRAVGVEHQHAVGRDDDDGVAVEADVSVGRGLEEMDAWGNLCANGCGAVGASRGGTLGREGTSCREGTPCREGDLCRENPDKIQAPDENCPPGKNCRPDKE